MVKFLIHRPIAVTMAFLALLLLGLVAGNQLPVSLMPDVDIPEITVAVNHPDVSARELENTVVASLRRNLVQVPQLEEIESESRNGSALLRLRFKYGANINLCFMEVSEKIDASMNSLPRDLERPRVIKASVTDMPVYFLNLSMKEGLQSESRFLELSQFAQTVIRKRIEQLPEVAMADMTGQIKQQITVRPNQAIMQSMGITANDLQQAFNQNNLNVGTIQVKDAQYLYNLEFSSYLKSVEDIQQIYLRKGDRILQLKDVADIFLAPQKATGAYFIDGQQAVTLAIIKQSTAKMADLKTNMDELIGLMEADFPTIDFTISQDQTRILEFTISNLKQSLLLGGMLAFLIMFFFLRDGRSPWLIGISIPTSVVISLLLFNLIGLTINIISLSGLILGVGMMIDNSIIVTDNISQHRERGLRLPQACIAGTNEVIRPLLSSVLTTCAVFVPLIFLSGITGALFYDQAMAITIGLFVSLAVSITLLPTYYRLLFLKEKDGWLTRFIKKLGLYKIEDGYEKGMGRVFRRKRLYLLLFLLLIPLGVYLFNHIHQEKFPDLREDELLVFVDWNENIDLPEHRMRVDSLLHSLENQILTTNIFLGEQQFLFTRGYDHSFMESRLYLRAKSPEARAQVSRDIQEWFRIHYPNAFSSSTAQESIFEKLFPTDEVALTARVSHREKDEIPSIAEMEQLMADLQEIAPEASWSPLRLQDQLMVEVIPQKLILYQVDQTVLFNRLRRALNENNIGNLRTSTQLLPVIMADQYPNLYDILLKSTVTNRQGEEVPLSELTSIRRVQTYKNIHGGSKGEYVSMNIDLPDELVKERLDEFRDYFRTSDTYAVEWSGSLFSNKDMLREMLMVILVSVFLLYFILAAQFESLWLPFIVLLELPIDVAGALIALLIAGATINIMSMIGMVVMAGIIINDSILKIDTINHLRIKEKDLKKAIFEGGRRRLNPILMTSLTTILAMTPFLFGHDMGSELQKPLALAVIGGMFLGTIVSLFFIPLIYWWIYRGHEHRERDKE